MNKKNVEDPERSRRTKKLLKLALMIYLASFLIINWNDVSWIFNYQEVSGLVSDFFNPYPSIDASTIDSYFYPNHSQNNSAVLEAVAIKDIKTSYTDKQNTLEVPKINISIPIIFSTSAEKSALMKDLDLGVVYYPGSVYPGQAGQIVILGHSAPPGWPHIKHDWAFTDLDKLSPGDTILVDLNNKQYTYVVKEKKIIQRGADIPVYNSVATDNVLTLISCWPPGKDYQRITVTAELD
ncbi:MAG: class E sortase [Candidatus Staskawiczbacteria bacterium]|nr:class E sortase [Candidatus Staskawiczbacteria bacterium]